MSTLDTAIAVEDVPIGEQGRRSRFAAIEQTIGRLGEYLNPILVKEARQALKSKQFSITFALLLTLVWVWSLLAGVWINPENFADAPRQSLVIFMGYFVLLAFPLILVVPYSAFRSLAGEIEDGTYELLSITALSPRQIIGGKMGSAMLQMMLYLSAVSPCLAFTYLLPGVDIVTIGLILLYVTAASALLSILSLLLATIASQRHWQILLQVFLIVGLCFALWCVCGFGAVMIQERAFESAAREFGLWFGVGWILANAASLFLILFMCAKAMITFDSENRSTGIRMALLLPPLITFGGLTFANLHFDYEPESILTAIVPIAIYWGIAGSMITAESPRLSARMLRQLPQSLLGRACSAWFNPGPASGYMFVVLNFLAVPLVVTALGYLNLTHQGNPFAATAELGKQIELAWLLWLYLVIFLGVNRLLITRLHYVAAVNVFLGFLTTLLLFLAGIAAPVLVQFFVTGAGSMDYTQLHVSNLPYTCVELFTDGRNEAALFQVKWMLAAAAAAVLLLNARGIWLSLLYDRAATPTRVVADDAAQDGARLPSEPEKRNPWDEQDDGSQ